MAKIKVSDGVDTGLTSNGAKTVSLTFSTESELVDYAAFAQAAKEDDRSINSYLVRVLTGKEENPVLIQAPATPNQAA